jgi:hypothetical protein
MHETMAIIAEPAVLAGGGWHKRQDKFKLGHHLSLIGRSFLDKNDAIFCLLAEPQAIAPPKIVRLSVGFDAAG